MTPRTHRRRIASYASPKAAGSSRLDSGYSMDSRGIVGAVGDDTGGDLGSFSFG